MRAGSARGQVLEVQSEVSKVPGKVPEGSCPRGWFWSKFRARFWKVPVLVGGSGCRQGCGRLGPLDACLGSVPVQLQVRNGIAACYSGLVLEGGAQKRVLAAPKRM